MPFVVYYSKECPGRAQKLDTSESVLESMGLYLGQIITGEQAREVILANALDFALNMAAMKAEGKDVPGCLSLRPHFPQFDWEEIDANGQPRTGISAPEKVAYRRAMIRAFMEENARIREEEKHIDQEKNAARKARRAEIEARLRKIDSDTWAGLMGGNK